MKTRWQIAVLMTAIATLIVTAGSGVLPIASDTELNTASAAGAPAPAGLYNIPSSSGHLADDAKPTGPEYYIIQLEGEPLAAYRGDVPGLPATSPEVTGETTLDSNSPASAAYLNHLAVAQDQFITSAEALLGRPVQPQYRYRYAYNGLAVWLTPAEAGRIAKLEGVVHVERNTYERLDTDAGPAWIGAKGVWDGSTTGGLGGAMGEGVIIAMIDTGINMDHPSFADVGGDGYNHTNPFGEGNYVGFCDPGNPNYAPRYKCNDKLIGAWSYPEVGMSPEDDNGHGSHTSSTAAGNVYDSAKLFGPGFTIVRAVSGVAPHANIIAYDACARTCPVVALDAAIDQAVADGVDVINYSIGPRSGHPSPWTHSQTLAFLNARKAGVIVAASAGNNGPAQATVGVSGPWMMSVAATTHDRKLANGLLNMTGGDTEPPSDIIGLGLTPSYGQAPIVYAAGYGASVNPDDGRCLSPFPAGTFHGEIVVCDYGLIALATKGVNVRAGGAGGMVLANTVDEGDALLLADYSLPAVHITYADAQSLKAWLASGEGHKAEIAGAFAHQDPIYGDIMTDFSSRGPTMSSLCCVRPGSEVPFETLLDVLKPDVTAPGDWIFAAVKSNPSSPAPEPEFGLISGTSMSSPHVAGAFALMRNLRPDWTPAEIQSAVMSTAFNEGVLNEDAETPASPFEMGAGRVDLGRAVRAALVLDIPNEDFDSADPAVGGEPAALNLASMADSECLVNCGWTRTVSSTLALSETWTATATADAGLTLTVSPKLFALGAGETQEIHIEADAGGVPFDEWAFGEVRLTPSGEDVPDTHFPVAVRSVQAELPGLVVIEAENPTGEYAVEDVRTIDAPELTLTGHGFVKAEITEMSLEEDPTPTEVYDLRNSTGTMVVAIDVPAGTRRLVAEITASEAPDIDLFVGRDTDGNGVPREEEEQCRSGSPAWLEYCDVEDPEPGRYWILVQNWNASESAPDDVKLAAATVLEDGVGNLYVSAPSSASLGEPFDIAINWLLEESEPWDRYFGAMDLGTDPASPGNLGSVPIDLYMVEPPTIYLPIAHRIWPEPTEEPVPTVEPEAR